MTSRWLLMLILKSAWDPYKQAKNYQQVKAPPDRWRDCTFQGRWGTWRCQRLRRGIWVLVPVWYCLWASDYCEYVGVGFTLQGQWEVDEVGVARVVVNDCKIWVRAHECSPNHLHLTILPRLQKRILMISRLSSPRAESAGAVTGRQCPNSGEGEDFLTCRR